MRADVGESQNKNYRAEESALPICLCILSFNELKVGKNIYVAFQVGKITIYTVLELKVFFLLLTSVCSSGTLDPPASTYGVQNLLIIDVAFWLSYCFWINDGLLIQKGFEEIIASIVAQKKQQHI